MKEQEFKLKQVVDFGNYLLSKKRSKLIDKHPTLSDEQKEISKTSVSDADLSNFLETNKVD